MNPNHRKEERTPCMTDITTQKIADTDSKTETVNRNPLFSDGQQKIRTKNGTNPKKSSRKVKTKLRKPQKTVMMSSETKIMFHEAR